MEESECGPSIYFHSLRHGQTIRRILGGEAFIDFVVPNISSLGASARQSDYLVDVYYLTNAYFEKRWKPIQKEATLNNVFKGCNNRAEIVKQQMSFEDCERDNDCVSFPIKEFNRLSYEEDTFEKYTSTILAKQLNN